MTSKYQNQPSDQKHHRNIFENSAYFASVIQMKSSFESANGMNFEATPTDPVNLSSHFSKFIDDYVPSLTKQQKESLI